ncbi:MAG: hypothetical protein M3R30_09340, partial [Candidatus Eremiobacteraeota bacterium]|nr:hypothetical protein [Candidatus Eremiobacteraeota bacterium]
SPMLGKPDVPRIAGPAPMVPPETLSALPQRASFDDAVHVIGKSGRDGDGGGSLEEAADGDGPGTFAARMVASAAGLARLLAFTAPLGPRAFLA